MRAKNFGRRFLKTGSQKLKRFTQLKLRKINWAGFSATNIFGHPFPTQERDKALQRSLSRMMATAVNW
jgi:hypothetical protein